MEGVGVTAPAFSGTGDQTETSGKGVGITWENRPSASKFQWFCLTIYIAIFGLFMVQGAMALSKQNMRVMHPDEPCPEGWWRRDDSLGVLSQQDHWCLHSSLKESWDTCQKKLDPVTTTAGKQERDLEKKEQQEDEGKTQDMWSILGNNVAVSATIFPSIVLFAVGWFFALKNFPFAVVYGTIGVGIAIFVLLGVNNIMEDPNKDVQRGLGNFMGAGAGLMFTFLMRKQISFICRVCAASCKILKLRLSIFAASFVLKLIWALLISLSLWILVASSQIVEVREEVFEDSTLTKTLCRISVAGQKYQMYPGLAFIAISIFFDMALVLVSSVGIGGYYFHKDDPSAPAYPAFTALGWVFSRSSGAVAESSIVVVLIRWAEQYMDLSKGSAWLCVCNPFWWFLKCLWMCFASVLSTLSRFLLIMHGFHGGDFSTADPRRPGKEALVKHLGTAFTNGVVGEEVLSFSASLLATCIGLGTHVWLDSVEGVHLFTENPALFKCVPIMYLFLADVYYKFGLATLVILTMFRGLPAMRWFFIPAVACVCAGLFVCFVAKLVIQFFVDVVFHSTDGLLYCLVLDQEAGNPVPEDMQEIFDVIQESKAIKGEEEMESPEAQIQNYGATADAPAQQKAEV
jgi:hypothetical protein